MRFRAFSSFANHFYMADDEAGIYRVFVKSVWNLHKCQTSYPPDDASADVNRSCAVQK